MKDDSASRTADRVAERRAAHQVLDTPRVFDDPVAVRIIRADRARVLRDNPAAYDTTYDRYLRAFVCVRSRIAEDALRDAYAHGVRQYIVLGAGFDTFAYRNPFPDLRVWEIDHPATQAEKRRRVADGALPVPSTLTYVAADLERISFAEALSRGGVDTSRPAFVAWLGVAMYLEMDDVRKTLAAIGAMAPGSGVTLDYAVPPATLNWIPRLFYKRVLARVASIGEPFKSFFDPEAAAHLLRDAGFARITDLGADEINARYFGGRSARLKVGPSGRVVTALR